MATRIYRNADVWGERRTVVTENGRIIEVTARDYSDGTDLHGKTVIPGLIDVHTHGRMGVDVMDADFAPLCREYAKQGTTSFLPTTMTMDLDSLRRVAEAKTDFPGANVLGFHFEGPYISPKYKGAQNEVFIRKPSAEEFFSFPRVKMITIAPESEGSDEFIRAVSGECVVSLGHTDCDYETALRAINLGANCLTHTFNAMPPLHHRRPGPIGAGIERHIYAQLICDGFHIAKPVVLAAYRAFGPDRLTLISDSLACAGLPDGEYESGGLTVVLKDSAARLRDGTIAGSYATLWDCVKKATEFGIPFADAVRMASQTPAELLGVNKGRIESGYDADLLILSDGEIETVIIGGEEFDPRD